MTETRKCVSCELVAKRDMGNAPIWDSILRTPFWDVVHCNDTALLGWTVLVTHRHIGAIDELTQAEALELGTLLRKVSLALKKIVHCSKTYVIQMAEAEGHHHVHFHVIPRMANLSEEYRSVNIFKLLGVSEKERVSEESMNDFALQMRRFLESE